MVKSTGETDGCRRACTVKSEYRLVEIGEAGLHGQA